MYILENYLLNNYAFYFLILSISLIFLYILYFLYTLFSHLYILPCIVSYNGNHPLKKFREFAIANGDNDIETFVYF